MIDLDFAEQNATEAELNEGLYGLEQQLADTLGKGGVVELINGSDC
jgi:hypothetical protein